MNNLIGDCPAIEPADAFGRFDLTEVARACSATSKLSSSVIQYPLDQAQGAALFQRS